MLEDNLEQPLIPLVKVIVRQEEGLHLGVKELASFHAGKQQSVTKGNGGTHTPLHKQ